MSFRTLLQRLSCAFGNHNWKRTVRTLGNAGSQVCRACGTKRLVVLRPRRQLTHL